MTEFRKEIAERVAAMRDNDALVRSAANFLKESVGAKYSYNFHWMNRPIIQYPQDIVAMQELIWLVQPDLIIETGIAHGGSLTFSASMLALLDLCEAIEGDYILDLSNPKRMVVGVDIDIRAHNRVAIENHPMARRVQMIEGSSVDKNTIDAVHRIASDYSRIMVCLDSNHTHAHVLEELNHYAMLTSVGSYCVVFDTLVEDMPADAYPNRPWGVGNSPKSALEGFLGTTDSFEVDNDITDRLLISVAHGGFLKRVR